ncbi:MAG: protoheme IX farnesyltransferase [Verrucomicrobia bacterium]|nr:protoheme IX farnesyltransferase [Verrucomicrobiota bacterium]
MDSLTEKHSPIVPVTERVSARRYVADLSQLVKTRLTALVLVTTLMGFLLAWHGEMNYLYLFHVLCGTALAAAGAAALNQVFEVELDARMHRTRNRPLPAGRMNVDEGLIIGIVCSAAGIIYTSVATNVLTGIFTAVTVGTYLFAYTPLKRVTTLNTIVGAIPGALPPVIGWTAVRGEASLESWILFAILFLWQMPHFLAISWLYREDYRSAGFVMLSGQDPDCSLTGRQALLYTMGVISVSLLPVALRLTTFWYLPVALVTGAYFFCRALRFALTGTERAARNLFVASIIYLPVTLGALVFTRFS